ncbi:putative nucleoporin [Cavenderia fasciculata]|uniref:Nucleoporin n=1 Tax=Cavenderia fasciculata TaxID=261658 RepID=F4PP73_CACFS|nr:putative nucleoporin [Cavenderia fasciculata]EGG22186.1 putative nucleoporin [Cavenderia fasciculata]|eukprot:XP_004360037.1 putative nucleoporin [Cavenderia fasciculata]
MPSTTSSSSSSNIVPSFHHQTEVELRSFGDNFDHWREFYLSSPSSSSSSTTTTTCYRSGGFSYSNTPHTRNRFILWRANNSVLELSEFDMGLRLDDSSIRINFPATINQNSGVCIFECNQQYIVIMVLLDTKILYRFTFVHPCADSSNLIGNKRKQDQYANSLGGLKKSIFYNISIGDLENSASMMRSPLIGGGDSVEVTVCKILSPTRLCVATNHSNYALWIELSDVSPPASSHHHQHQHQQDSMDQSMNGDLTVIKKVELKEGGFLSSFIPSKYTSSSSSSSPVQDIQFLQHQSQHNPTIYVFVLHADNTIKIWSAQEKQCLFTFTIDTENWSQTIQSSSSTRKMFKLYNHNLNSNNFNLLSFSLILYIEMEESESHFQFYSGLIEPNNTRLQLQRVSYTKSTGLIDFSVTAQKDTLYALFKSDSTTSQLDQSDYVNDSTDSPSYSIEYISCAGVISTFVGDGSNDVNMASSDEYSENINMEYNIFHKVDIAQQQRTNDKPPSADSIESHYLERLFNRGYFSKRSIQKALNIYSPSYSMSPTIPLEYQISKLIKKKITNLSNIGNNQNNSVDDQQEEMIAYNEWNEFYQICLNQAKYDIQPTGLFINQSLNLIFIVKMNKLSIIRNNIEKFDSLLSSSIGSESFNSALQQLGSQFQEEEVQVRNIEYVLECCKMIDKSVDYDYSSIEYDLQRSQTNTALASEVNSNILTCSINSMADRVSTTMKHKRQGARQSNNQQQMIVQSKFTVEFTKLFKMIETPIKTISSLIVLLNQDFEKESSSLQNNNNNGNSDLFSDMIVSCFKQSIQAKYQFARSLSLLLCIVSRLRSQLSLSCEQLLTIEKNLTPTTYRVLNTYYTLYWFTNQLYYPSSSSLDIDHKMNIIDKKQQQTTFKSPLLFVLISQNMDYFSTLLTPSTSILDNIQLQIEKIVHLLAYKNDVFPIATYLTEKQQFKQLSVLLTMIQKNRPILLDESLNPLTTTTTMPSYYYLMGLCFAHFSKYSEAYQYLIKSSESLKLQGEISLDSIDPHIKHICILSDEELVPNIFTINNSDISPPSPPPPSIAQMLYKLLLKCSKVFELRNQLDYCIQLSLLAIQYSPQQEHGQGQGHIGQTNDISNSYVNIFKYAIKMSQYQVAYQAIVMNPDRRVMLECLEKFIVILSEGYGKSDVLESLPFVGIYQHVEAILLNKARAQDLLVSPDYYSILYSLQMNHSNYNKAAAIIYEKSTRIISETSASGKFVRNKGSAADTSNLYQSKLNYLSMSINCLELIENENNRWISIDNHCFDHNNNNSNGKGKRKVNSNNNIILSFQKHNENDNNDNDNNNNDDINGTNGGQSIIMHKDIKKEYLFYNCHFMIYQMEKQQDSSSPTSSSSLPIYYHQENNQQQQSNQQLIQKLIQFGMIDKCFSLAVANDLDMSVIFKSFTTMCIEYELDPTKNPFSFSPQAFDTYNLHYLNDNVKIVWSLLAKYLERYDSFTTDPAIAQSTYQIANNKIATTSNQVYGQVIVNSVKQNKDGFYTFQISSGSLGQGSNNKLDVILLGHHNGKVVQKYLPPFFKEGYGVVLGGKMVSSGQRFEATEIYCKSGIDNCQQQAGYYYELVANQLLEYPLQQLPLPEWLLNAYFFKSNNNNQQQQQRSLSRLGSLFKLYYKNNRVEEAAKTLESIFSQAVATKSTLSLPSFNSIDQFMVECKQLLANNNNNRNVILEDSNKKSLQLLFDNIQNLIKNVV